MSSLTQKISEQSLKEFKRIVRYSMSMDATDKRIFQSIPDHYFEGIFRDLYQGNIKLAKHVILNKLDDINISEAEDDINNIRTIDVASKVLLKTFDEQHPVMFISDVDNDGALTQAIMIEMKRATEHSISVFSKSYLPGTHGFSLLQIEKWRKSNDIDVDSSFLVVVCDLGTNQKKEQELFLQQYPSAKMIVIDHHKPDIENKVRTIDERAILVSPYTKGGGELSLLSGGGVSSGYLLYKVLENTLVEMQKQSKLKLTKEQLLTRLEPMNKMAKAANMLDFVDSDVRLKPLDIDEAIKANKVASQSGQGRALGAWCSANQKNNIKMLTSLIGDDGVKSLESLRQRYLIQNHSAKALYETVFTILSKDNKESVASIYTKNLINSPVELSYPQSYIQLIKPYIFNLNYETQFSKEVKEQWLTYANNCFRELGVIDKEVLNFIREYKLLNELSLDYALITQTASVDVVKVFTAQQLSKAHHTIGKPIALTISSINPKRITFNCRSEISLFGLMHDLKKDFVFADFIYMGHAGAGGLTMMLKPGVDHETILKYLVSYLNEKGRMGSDIQQLLNVINVNTEHLPLLMDINNKTRASLYGREGQQLHPLLTIRKEMVFEDGYTNKKMTAEEVCRINEWENTAVPLDFSNKQTLIIPNQSLKTLANSDFTGRLKLQQIGDGVFMAMRIITQDQLAVKPLPFLNTRLEKDRQRMSKLYKEKFKNTDNAIISIPRNEAIEAIKFTKNNKKAFELSENVILGMLSKSNSDCYAVLDVEADGAGNAQCFNVGITLYKRNKKSGTKITADKFQELLQVSPEKIRNHRLMSDGMVNVNEKITIDLMSLLISRDVDIPIRISLKSQNLTNITPEMLDELGCSTEEAQTYLLNAFKPYKKTIFQAHNLPYDNNIIRVNFPEFYEFMAENIHLDSAVLAREHIIGYINLEVNKIGGVDFVDSFHQGYNVSTVLKSPDQQVNFPSLNGTHTLQIRGDEVFLLEHNSQRTTPLNETRQGLIKALPKSIKRISTPKYGIALLLRMAVIKDIIMQKPVMETRYHDFDGVGALQIDNKLWEKFQDNYAYDLTVSKNITQFMVLDEVRKMMAVSVELSDAPNFINESISYGQGVSKRKKVKVESEPTICSGETIFKANVLEFVKKNHENIERFNCAWVYNLILDHYESTRKSVDSNLIDGIHIKTGVPKELIKKIYDDTYKYREDRQVSSYKVHETHNNIDLEGDAYQEGLVFLYMLNETEKNPYLPCEQYVKTVDLMNKQMVKSSISQEIRTTLKIALDADKFNSYSAKQMVNYHDDGITLKNDLGAIPKMECKSLSSSTTKVQVELPQFNLTAFKKLPDDERKKWERKLNYAVTILVLSNSRVNKKLSTEDVNFLESVVTSPEVLENLKDVYEFFGEMSVFPRESMMKNYLKGILDAVSGKTLAIKLPANKYLTPKDIAEIQKGVFHVIDMLKDKLGFTSKITKSELLSYFTIAKDTYESIHNSIEAGEIVEPSTGEPLTGANKSARTAMINSYNKVLNDHMKVNKGLSSSLFTAKKEPFDFLLTSGMGTIELLKPLIDNCNEIKKTTEISDVLTTKNIRR